MHETDQPGDFELEDQLEPPFDVLFSADTRKTVAEIQKAEQSQPRNKNKAPTPEDRRSDSSVTAVPESTITSNITPVVPPTGIEPVAFGTGNRRSIP